jgi:hypothetical protein
VKRKTADIHADWLRLVEPEGQFLTAPALKQAFDQGYDSVGRPVRENLRTHYPKGTPTEAQWNDWLRWLFEDALEWGECYRTGDVAATYERAVPEHGIVLHADGALIDPSTGKPRVLVVRYPHGTDLGKKIAGDRWNVSPIDRVKELCKSQSVRLGIATDGERVSLIWVPPSGTGGHATWDTSLFTESAERGLFQSFISLLRASRFFAVREAAQIESLFEASAKFQNEVTGQLGYQVRQAVELLVNAISRANVETDGKLLAEIPPRRVYEAAATVMMRLVFLLYAEERDLLPLDEEIYAEHYAVSTLREQLERQAAIEGDEPLERRNAAWYRLLATFRVIYSGVKHDRLNLSGYGGRLFDPDRFPFLEGRSKRNGTRRPLPIDDLSVKAILEAIQTLPIAENGSKERRKLSFRALDVEQIGHVYEGLLDHGVVRIDDLYVGLEGKGEDDEVPLSEIEAASSKGQKRLVAFLAEKTKRSESAIQNLLAKAQSVSSGKDADMRRRLQEACDNDRDLMARLTPIAYLMREDLRGLPLVFKPGALVLKQTKARRDSGTEYTPRELAEEMVQYALEPLVYSPGPRDGVEPDKWKLRPSKELLDLKICDPAVGSGAFLVSACRYLSDRVVEAWITEDARLANTNRDELTLDARRAVVDRCLYGVDRDSMAVEMAKLSLWLITMARERPFSFLDHSIREGDSLLGVTTPDQVLYAHMDPIAGRALYDGSLFDVMSVVKPLVDRAAELRRELEALPNVTVRDTEAKQHLNDEASGLLAAVSIVADAIVATALTTSTEGEKQRNSAYVSASIRIREALDPSVPQTKREAAIESLKSSNNQMLNAGRPSDAPLRVPMHWALAFPEVFAVRGTGFDAMVGNPPFVGGQKISGTFGSDYRSFLVHQIGESRRGSADLVAYFFLRSAQLSRSFGLLAINTIAQGDTRNVGLDFLCADDWNIVRANKSRPWPGAAGVHIAQVWMTRGASKQVAMLDDEPAPDGISPLLTPKRKNLSAPFRLEANSGIVFNGSYVLGMGFTMPPAEASALIQRDPKNKDVLFPYLNAEDVCSRPDISPSRWVINFQNWPLDRAAVYGDCFRIVKEKVKPERDKQKDKSRREIWWRFTRPVPELYAAIAHLKCVIVMPRVSKVVLPVMVPTGTIFSLEVAVFASDDYGLFGVLSSTVHRDWARLYSGTLETRTRYAPTDCFQTFPLPRSYDNIADIMRQLSQRRSEFMRDKGVGLTSFYNCIHIEAETNERIKSVRDLHADLDRAVCDSYGWSDLDLAYGFYRSTEGTRWTICDATRNEIHDRLLQLNHLRYAEEQANAPTDGHGSSVNGKHKRRKKLAAPVHEQQMALY